MIKTLIVGNWKMNTDSFEAYKLTSNLIDNINHINSVIKVICPPYIYIPKLHEIISSSNLYLGSQNMFYKDAGPYTGEISPKMLKEYCEYVILGHSERRTVFEENDELINKKTKAAIENNIIPIICVGENISERESGLTKNKIRNQLLNSLRNLEENANISIAYEPIWAIGTGVAATPEIAQETMKYIRLILQEIFNSDTANKTPILYGGSVTDQNALEYLNLPDINGCLIGGASLDSKKFSKIVEIAAIK
jgi:triosephosphate isomerase|tara:strand:- start:101 stop:853 length:753 start_codon:yes stop_codon:yes gene_type:complete